MGRAFIRGDCHGSFAFLRDFCKENNTTVEDTLIILGDAGINYFLDKRDRKLKKYIAHFPITLFCVHGNHEERPQNISTYKAAYQEKYSCYCWYEEEFPNILFPFNGTATFNGKKFLIIGNGNAVTYKEIFPYIKDNKMWIGASKGIGGKFSFIVPNDYDNKFVYEENGVRLGQVNSACWFTNLEHKKRNEELILYKHYNPTEYPKYENYDAIEVSKVAEIPMDYEGVMGVPISFLDKYCPNQFRIVKFRKGDDGKDLSVNGKCPYFRILIQKII